MGPPVDEASHLKTEAGPGQILATDGVHRAVRTQFEMEDLPPYRRSPDFSPINLYRVVGRRGAPWDPVTLRAPLTGRDVEFTLLQHRLTRAVELQQGGGAFIVGQAGLGKSRIVAELRKWANGRGWLRAEDDLLAGDGPRILWLETRGLPAAGRQVALLAPIIRGCLGSQTPLTGPANLAGLDIGWQQLQDAIQERWPGKLADLAPYLASLLALPVDDPSLRERLIYLDVATLRQREQQALQFLLEETVAERPVVVALDDLHWADPYSLTLLSALIPLTRHCPLLWVGALEPQGAEHPVSRFLRRVRQELPHHCRLYLTLNPLSARESASLVGNLLLDHNLPANLLERILARAGGNPFFIEELLRGLIDHQQVQLMGGDWQMAEHLAVDDGKSALKLPDTAQAVLQQRLTRLPEAVQQTARAAAIIGRFFEASTLRRLLSLPSAETQARLDSLEQATIIRPRPGGEYAFHHTITQQAIYQSLPPQELKDLHAQVGDMFRQVYAETPEAGCELLAFHYGRSDKLELGFKYARLAGDKSCKHNGYRKAQRYYAQAQSLAEKLAAELAAIDMISAQANVRYQLGDLPAAIAAGRMALERAKAIRDIPRQVRSNEQLSFMGCLQGDRNSVLRFALTAHKLARAAEPDNSLAGSWSYLGGARQFRCEYRQAIHCYQQAVAQAGVSGNERLLATSHNNLGEIFSQLGDGERALAHFHVLLCWARKSHDRRLELLALSNTAGAQLLTGRLDEAEASVRQALNIAQLIGVADLVEPYLFLSQVHLARALIVQAWDSAGRARMIAETISRPAKLGVVQRTQGEIAAVAIAAGVDLPATGGPASYFRAGLQTLRAVQELEWARSLLAYGRYLIDEGNESEAQGYLDQANLVFKRLDVEP